MVAVVVPTVSSIGTSENRAGQIDINTNVTGKPFKDNLSQLQLSRQLSKTANNIDNKTQVRNKISQWIQDERFELLPEEDPYTDFAFKIKYAEDALCNNGKRSKRFHNCVYT